jgi:hypothetical protein
MSIDSLLRGVALIAAVAGAAASEILMFHVGRHNSSWVLMALFAVWVLAPFAALIWVVIVTRRRTVFCLATLAIILVSLAIYGDVALGPPRPKPAGMFLIVPLMSLLMIAIAGRRWGNRV